MDRFSLDCRSHFPASCFVYKLLYEVLDLVIFTFVLFRFCNLPLMCVGFALIGS